MTLITEDCVHDSEEDVVEHQEDEQCHPTTPARSIHVGRPFRVGEGGTSRFLVWSKMVSLANVGTSYMGRFEFSGSERRLGKV